MISDCVFLNGRRRSARGSEGGPEMHLNFGVYQHGIAAMDAMRLVDDENGCRVGGFIAHPEITREASARRPSIDGPT